MTKKTATLPPPDSITFSIETDEGPLTVEVSPDALDTFTPGEHMLMAALVGVVASGVGVVASGEEDYLGAAACASAVIALRTHPHLDPHDLAQAIKACLEEAADG